MSHGNLGLSPMPSADVMAQDEPTNSPNSVKLSDSQLTNKY